MTDQWAASMRARMCVPWKETAMTELNHRIELVEQHEITVAFTAARGVGELAHLRDRCSTAAQAWARREGIGISVGNVLRHGDAGDGAVGVSFTVTVGRQPAEDKNWMWSARWFDWAARFMVMRGQPTAETP